LGIFAGMVKDMAEKGGKTYFISYTKDDIVQAKWIKNVLN